MLIMCYRACLSYALAIHLIHSASYIKASICFSTKFSFFFISIFDFSLFISQYFSLCTFHIVVHLFFFSGVDELLLKLSWIWEEDVLRFKEKRKHSPLKSI